MTRFDQEFTTASQESLIFLTKAFRGAVNLEERENRALLSAASSTVASYTRMQQTTSAREATRFAMAIAIQREHDDMSVTQAMALVMPENEGLRIISSGE